MYKHSLRYTLAAVGVIGLVAFTPLLVGAENGRYFVSGSEEGLRAAQAIVGVGRHTFPNGFSDDLTIGQLKALMALSTVFDLTVEPVAQYYITKPPSGCEPWPACKDGDGGGDVVRSTPSDQTPWGIERVYGDNTITVTSGGAGVNVAVLDTGVNVNHLDLSQRIAQCTDFTHAKGEVNGKCDDRNGHGTHTAGTVLADGGADGLGIFGVAPQANLLAYKVCGNSGTCWGDDIAAAMRAAADRGADIVSMSLGSDVESSLIANAISYAVSKDVLVVAAAGNDGPADGSIDYPGANAQVVAVGATDSSDGVPSWSSRGINDGDGVIEAREVEFAAPGVAVESTWNDGSYRTISGTSMATPHVAGLAAKVWQGSADATRAHLQGLAQDIWTAGEDTATGFGLPQL